MVQEGRALVAVGDCTSCLHTVGHARWTTGEDSNLREQPVLLLEAVKELVEVGTPEMGDCLQTSEETAARQLLEVPLTDVLQREREIEVQ